MIPVPPFYCSDLLLGVSNNLNKVNVLFLWSVIPCEVQIPSTERRTNGKV